MSEVNNEQQEMVTETNPLAAAVWGDDVPPTTATVETPAEAVEAPVTTTTEEPKVEANPLKDNLGYDDWDAAKKEIEELRKLKDAAPTAVEAKKLADVLKEKEDEIFEVISRKKDLQRVEKLDITNPKDAAELIKASLKLKYKDLDAREIQDMFDEQYLRYEKPVQQLETDEEYADNLRKWEQRNEAIDRKMVRDAKIAKPELLQLQSQIVYPDIPVVSEAVKQELSQEDLEAFEKTKTSFLQSAETFMKTFNGFNAVVKDKDVEIPVSYELSKEEKTTLEKVVKNFAENGLNTNAIFAERWLNQDGSVNAERMVKDLSLILNEEKISSKYVNDAANKRLEAYIKGKKNVNVEGQPTAAFNPGGEKTEQAALAEWIWAT